MQLNSIHDHTRLENERAYLPLKPELRHTLYIAAWAITAVMGVAGVTTYYSSNPTALGAVMAFLLFLGFMLTMKSASALLFDPQMPGILRFLALLCIIAVVIIDVFAFSHEKQTGVMARIESANAVVAGHASKTEQLSQLQAELAACPPNHYTKCRAPLLQAIQTAQRTRRIRSASTRKTRGKTAIGWHWQRGTTKASYRKTMWTRAQSRSTCLREWG
ncbi:MAG: hypothetical protein BWK73_53040 [Thiothrix lacustris]|uniref:Uncharacterized protein n=1 Tax=Thiothrix lacustris TaxID=525917 RepID=A0A1Y1Q769_9GAMM|nr:MAG: hypothetical protein BWK73_53040 [Thiothrix lacustris]